MTKEKQGKKEQNVMTTNPQNIIPKLCNIINFEKLNENNIVMTFLFKEPTNEQTILLDRFLIDKNHAQQVIEVLNTLLQ